MVNLLPETLRVASGRRRPEIFNMVKRPRCQLKFDAAASTSFKCDYLIVLTRINSESR